MALETHQKQLEADLAKAQAEIAKITRLKEEFPDLESQQDRWKTVRYMAASANPRVDQVEFRRSCGCCQDAGVLGMPYVEFEGTRVYSNPHYLFIGEGAWNGGVIEQHGWRKVFETAGVSYHALDRIKEYLKTMTPRGEEELDDDDT
jgi:hypothetical protein